MDLPLTTGVAADVLFLDSVESTNAYLASTQAHLQDFSVIASLNQTAGRGRRGRQWVSVPGQTLAVSVVVPFESEQIATTWLPILAGVAVVQALKEISDQPVELKWPNDLLADGLKIGGILCQMISSSRSIVGVGANFSVSEEDLPVNGGSIWHPHHDLERAVDLYLSTMVEHLRALLHTVIELSDGDLIADFFCPSIKTVGKTVRVHETESLSWSGKAVGLSPEGHLIVRLPDGEEREVAAADIEHLRE